MHRANEIPQAMLRFGQTDFKLAHGIVRVDKARVYVRTPLAQVVFGIIAESAAWRVGHRGWASIPKRLPQTCMVRAERPRCQQGLSP